MKKILLGKVLIAAGMVALTTLGSVASAKTQNNAVATTEAGLSPAQKHHHRLPGHGFGSGNTLGSMTAFRCGAETVQAFFTNINGQVFVGTSVNTTGACSNAGVTWSGLNGVQLNTLSFDVLGPPCTNDEVFALFSFVDLASPPNATFACSNLIAQPIGNNFTRYFIHFGSPTAPAVDSVTFAQLGSSAAQNERVFGNFLLNGTISPVIDTTPSPCPAFLNCQP